MSRINKLSGYAQNITVKGVVTSAADKEPMIGLTALIKGDKRYRDRFGR